MPARLRVAPEWLPPRDPATGAEHFVFEGDQVAIDGVEVTYESLCGSCYLAESGGRLG